MSNYTFNKSIVTKLATSNNNRKHKVVLFAGGGLFGYTTLYLLTSIKDNWLDKVDTIGGTSIGGILSLACALNPDIGYLTKSFKQNGPSIFKKKWYSVVNLFGPKYDSKVLEKFVHVFMGDAKLSDVRKYNNRPLNFITLCVDFNNAQPIVINNIENNEEYNELLCTTIGMATSAAPTYFSPVELMGRLTIDGGVIENIPINTVEKTIRSNFGIHPEDIDMFVIGTGANYGGHQWTVNEVNSWSVLSWLKNFLIPYVTTSNEMVSTYWGAKTGFNTFTYYNPIPMSGEMDDPSVLDQIEQKITPEVLKDFEQKFTQFLNN